MAVCLRFPTRKYRFLLVRLISLWADQPINKYILTEQMAAHTAIKHTHTHTMAGALTRAQLLTKPALYVWMYECVCEKATQMKISEPLTSIHPLLCGPSAALVVARGAPLVTSRTRFNELSSTTQHSSERGELVKLLDSTSSLEMVPPGLQR